MGYGYFGDGNFYLNILVLEYNDKVSLNIDVKYLKMFFKVINFFLFFILQFLGLIELYVYEWILKYCGSISVEYGLGVMKVNEIFYSKLLEIVS